MKGETPTSLLLENPAGNPVYNLEVSNKLYQKKDSQRYPQNHYLIANMQNIVVFFNSNKFVHCFPAEKCVCKSQNKLIRSTFVTKICHCA